MRSEFSNIRSSASVAKVKLELVQEMTRFVARGIKQVGSASLVRWAPVSNAVQAALVESVMHGVTERVAEQEVRKRVLVSFFDEYDANSRPGLKGTVPPVALTRWDEEESLILERYGVLAGYKTVDPSLDGALEMAWLNLHRAQQRWMVWLCLGSLLHNTALGREQGSQEVDDFNAVLKALLLETRSMEKRVLMFALLKGGDAAANARDWVLRTTLAQGMSVMEYLEYDGQLPHSWSVADEEALRASLAAAR